MRIQIVTDSSTNVPDEYLSRLGIIEVPANVHFGQVAYLNKVELSIAEFYRRMETAERLPTTSQPTPGQFAAGYARAAAEGADEIVAVCVSSILSGTYNSAVMAAESAPVPVHVWDCQHVSMAAGWQAVVAAEMVRAGADVAAILAGLAEVRARVHMYFTPANLRILIASGRAPKLRGAIGEMLNIKPILTTIDGRLEQIGQVRGQHRALEAMLDQTIAVVGERAVRVAVGHCNVPEEVAAYAQMLRGRLNVVEECTFDLGPALAALGGPGLIGLAAYTVDA